ncbi:MAG TPA: hypothetical protein VGH86_01910 [Phenylobacterium sp.]|jgi:hypothetical protein
MDWSGFEAWLTSTPLAALGFGLFAAMGGATVLGGLLRLRLKRDGPDSGAGEGYIVSAVLGLLALLLGFTFSLAVDRFDARRVLVLQEANAIGTAYLQSQLLPEPHRGRMSELLVRYTANRIALAKEPPGATQARLLATSDTLVTDIWSATGAAFDSIKGIDFSSTYVASVNTVIELDGARRAARTARVPAEVFAVLFVYMVSSAGVLGYVLDRRDARIAAGLLLILFTVSLMLIVDIDRPTAGGIVESQAPMEALLKTLEGEPPAVFDRWRTPTEAPASPHP